MDYGGEETGRDLPVENLCREGLARPEVATLHSPTYHLLPIAGGFAA